MRELLWAYPLGETILSFPPPTPDKPLIGMYRADPAMGDVQSSKKMSSHGWMSSHDCECPAQSWEVEYIIIDGDFQLWVIGRMF